MTRAAIFGGDDLRSACEVLGLEASPSPRLVLVDLRWAGAAEEAAWRTAGVSLEAAGALADGFNDRPMAACRPYDRDRRGLVLSEGAGILVLEALEYAQARGAQPLAEIVAYAAANDGADVFRPSGEGLRSVLRTALAQAAEAGLEQVSYVNSHATGTPLGDAVEAGVLREVFGDGANVGCADNGAQAFCRCNRL